MKIVIDIDDEDYKRIQDVPDVFNSLTSRAYSAIRNGTPADGFVVMGVTEEDIDLAPTIIEADKGVLEKINEKQDSLRATCKAWDEAISRDGYVN